MKNSFLLTLLFPFLFSLQAQEIAPQPAYKIKNISAVNTKSTEFVATVLGNELIFVSDRENNLLEYGEQAGKNANKLNLYKTNFTLVGNDSVNVSNPVLFRGNQPANYHHEGPICFHPSGNYAIVTRVVFEQKHNRPQLYWMKKDNGKWSKPVRLPFCGNEFSYGHACFSDDGKILYFSSNQLGNVGGKDIFSCTFDEGKFGSPFNLGDKVNSVKDEVFPFFQQGKLYFSSDQEGTLGGLDFFVSAQSENGLFEKAVNMGKDINSNADDISLVFQEPGHKGFFASGREGNDNIYFFAVQEQPMDIVGTFTYSRLTDGLPSGLELQLIDESGNLVQKTTTNEKGQFKFTDLSPDHNYSLKTVQLTEELLLHIYNKDEKEVLVLMSDTKGSFVYKKLDPGQAGTLSFMELEETCFEKNKKGTVSGQFIHERLNGGLVNGVDVLLLDESGNVYARTKTDKNGNFDFSCIPTDQNFLLSTNSTDDDLKILIYNKNGEVVAELRREGMGPFIFRRINDKYENSLSLMNEPDLDLFPQPKNMMVGKFAFDKLGAETGNLEFAVMDEAGNITMKGNTDKKGNFRLLGLDPADVCIFKMDNKDMVLVKRGLKLELLNRYGEEIKTIDTEEAGLYNINCKPALPFVREVFTVYFNNNQATLDAESKTILDHVLKQAQINKTFKVQLDAYTDPSYTEGYNLQLSRMRMQAVKKYLVSKGISTNRIQGAYHGESKLVNNCTDVQQCPDNENRKNRRCEIQVISAK